MNWFTFSYELLEAFSKFSDIVITLWYAGFEVAGETYKIGDLFAGGLVVTVLIMKTIKLFNPVA